MATLSRLIRLSTRRTSMVLAIGAGLLAVLAAGIAIANRTAGAAGPNLAAIELDVVRRWPMIDQVARADLGRWLSERRDVVLIDVREPAEYAVSHLTGAIRIAPDMPAAQFLATHAPAVAGKTVVFYCSVGVRSSILAARVQDELKSRGAGAVYNLTGGIFGWHNDGRPLVDAAGATDRVHGYDARWGRLVTRRSQVDTSAQ